ncbi:MAG: manganese efflux pump [Lachnospiraceae bacterium]|nr:manganese efflux pump [Lachnospiraceae bacterium]
MTVSLLFIINSILFGIGLAMDAFSVSVANGLREPDMPLLGSVKIAGTFGFFQTFMPLAGWLCVRFIVEAFQGFQPFIPWIALILLLYIGIKMIREGISGEEEKGSLQGGALFIQGIATSIDALSVGFAIAGYDFIHALAESLIIGAVTFLICTAGLHLGKRIGEKLSGMAPAAGGVILILIGVEIFITGVFKA